MSVPRSGFQGAVPLGRSRASLRNSLTEDRAADAQLLHRTPITPDPPGHGSEAAPGGGGLAAVRLTGCYAAGQGLLTVLLRKSLERLVMVPYGAVG